MLKKSKSCSWISWRNCSKNQHDENGNPFELLKTSIRGIESNGMICSSYELDLGNDADGILILPKIFPLAVRFRNISEVKMLYSNLALHQIALIV